MNWVEKLRGTAPKEPNEGDEFVKGYAEGVNASADYINSIHSPLAINLLNDKKKLAFALSNGGYCSGDFLEGLPSVNVKIECMPEPDKCKKCWDKYLGGSE